MCVLKSKVRDTVFTKVRWVPVAVGGIVMLISIAKTVTFIIKLLQLVLGF